MSQTVVYPDLELSLTGHLRTVLNAWTALVDRRYPPTDWVPGFAIVVRNDSGPDITAVTATRNVGITVIGPQDQYKHTSELAEHVAAVLRAIPDEMVLPIADAKVRGPYSLDATGRTEFYLTAEMVVVGTTVTL